MKTPELHEAYKSFISEYQRLQHMHISSQCEQQAAECYLAHHAVLRNNDPSKIKVEFNASQKYRNGVSLNDLLLPGPKLETDISIILTNWRFLEFVFTADIVKKFRQILVHPEDARWQHILWRENVDSPVIDFQANMVTYGTAPAPFLAIRTLLQLAEGGASQFPLAAEISRRHIYVDDIFAGADSIEISLSYRNQLVELLASADMSLSKWAANDSRLLANTSNEQDTMNNRDGKIR